MELSRRSFNCLQAAGIKYIHELVSKEENQMLKYKNFGRKSLTELVDKLSSSAELNDFHYNSVSYYPIYYRCKETGKKMLKSLNLKVKPLLEDEFVVITIDEIEKTGASWEEFVDFLKFSDATLVDYKSLL